MNTELAEKNNLFYLFQSSTMGARAWISMPGQGYPPGGRYIPAPAGVVLLLEKKEYPCPGMGILLERRIPLPGHGRSS